MGSDTGRSQSHHSRALAKAQELNIKISAAVCDSGGRLIALQRMDNAIWASAYGSQGKAVASAAFGRPSGEMSERADEPTPRGIAAASGGNMIMGQGAVPIIRNGIVEGACGVGGGPRSRTRTAPGPESRSYRHSRRKQRYLFVFPTIGSYREIHAGALRAPAFPMREVR